MSFPGGFEPFLAYHGLIQASSNGFECCLCMIGKRTWWRNKKDAVRHLRKFHFGLADRCDIWYVLRVGLIPPNGVSDSHTPFGTSTRLFYSTGEMTSHRCVPPKGTIATISTTEPELGEPESGTLAVLGNLPSWKAG